MRWVGMILVLLTVAGCVVRSPEHAVRPAREPAAASALAFDPPVAIGEPELALAREPRQLSAYIGYSQGAVEFLTVLTDDRVRISGGSGNGFFDRDRYERRSIAVRQSTLER